jgi:hypothetical protein
MCADSDVVMEEECRNYLVSCVCTLYHMFQSFHDQHRGFMVNVPNSFMCRAV